MPAALSVEEVRVVLAVSRFPVQGEYWLPARWLRSTGLLFSEAIQLRVKDLDFAQLAPSMREGKGVKGRIVVVPQSPLLN